MFVANKKKQKQKLLKKVVAEKNYYFSRLAQKHFVRAAKTILIIVPNPFLPKAVKRAK